MGTLQLQTATRLRFTHRVRHGVHHNRQARRSATSRNRVQRCVTDATTLVRLLVLRMNAWQRCRAAASSGD